MIDAATLRSIEKRLDMARELLAELENIRKDLHTYEGVCTEIVQNPVGVFKLNTGEHMNYRLDARLPL